MIEEIKEEHVTGWYTIDDMGLMALENLLRDNYLDTDVYIQITKIDKKG